MHDGVRAMWMRGGTSKGGFFLKEDLPADTDARDSFLLAVMGSPDARQIDGMGGGDPLTSKVAIVSRSERPGIDVDYLFLQVFVDRPVVSDAQNCGNMLAGVGPFAIERGLVAARDGETPVAIHMVNSGQMAVATVSTPGGRVTYAGDARIDGVPGSAAPVPLLFHDTAGAMCGAMLPTGNAMDMVEGYPATLIDNGMSCVILQAADFGIAGDEDYTMLDADLALKARVEAVRLAAGPRMNLGDVRDKPVPKMVLVSAPRQGGTISTRCLIPHRVHATIGVLAATTVATACLLGDGPAAAVAAPSSGAQRTIAIEHPSGITECVVALDGDGHVAAAGMLRTARKLFDGTLYAG